MSQDLKAWQVHATPFASLAASVGTLFCCALPSFLVVLGLGATVASVLAGAPWLVTLSRHKLLVFTAAGVLIGASWLYLHRVTPRLALAGAACPPGVARFARRVWYLSAALYTIGFAIAYGLAPVLKAFER